MKQLDFSAASRILEGEINKTYPAASLVVLHQGQVVLSANVGYLDPETNLHPVESDSLFDLASVTKLFTTTAFMRLVEQDRVSLDQPVASILPQFSGLRPIKPYEDPLNPGILVEPVDGNQLIVDTGRVTFRNLLSHNSGLPAWRPFKDQPDILSAYQMALDTHFFYPIASRVVYSDVGLILLGLSIEKITGMRLDEVIYKLVTKPLNLSSTHFLPVANQPHDTSKIVPTEFCTWRQHRILGEVHDENAYRLGGISGHAGLFSTAMDVARFGQVFLEEGAPLLKPESVAQMTRLQAEDGSIRRGIGFALWSPDPEASSNPFSQQAFGHTGFTGTSVWMDPSRDLVVALLTNRVYYGRDAAGIMELRVNLHTEIVKAVDACL